MECRGFGAAKEGLKFYGMKVVGEEAWIDQVWEEFEAQYLSQRSCKISTTCVIFVTTTIKCDFKYATN